MIHKVIKPLLSVIIPVYNRKHSLFEAVCSAIDAIEFAQKTRQFKAEIIVVDDGSDVPVVLDFDDKLRGIPVEVLVCRITQNNGVGNARNQGVSAARGQFVSFLDSDDQYLSNRFSADLNFMIQHGVEFCYGSTKDERAANLDWEAPHRKDAVTRFTSPTPMLGKAHAAGRHGHIHLNAVTILTKTLERDEISFTTLKRAEDTIFILECLDNLYSLPNPETRPVAKRIYHNLNSLKTNKKGTLSFLKSSLLSKMENRTKIAVIVDIAFQQPMNAIRHWLQS